MEPKRTIIEVKGGTWPKNRPKTEYDYDQMYLFWFRAPFCQSAKFVNTKKLVVNFTYSKIWLWLLAKNKVRILEKQIFSCSKRSLIWPLMRSFRFQMTINSLPNSHHSLLQLNHCVHRYLDGYFSRFQSKWTIFVGIFQVVNLNCKKCWFQK